jgi:hypothetical protein
MPQQTEQTELPLELSQISSNVEPAGRAYRFGDGVPPLLSAAGKIVPRVL